MSNLRGCTSRCAILAILLAFSIGHGAADAPSHPIVAGLASETTLPPDLEGLLLFSELNCGSCHDPGPRPGLFDPKGGPLLDDAALRINHQSLLDFIADPRRTKPGTAMPDALSHLPAAEKQSVARAITHFLISLNPDAPETPPVAPGSEARGRELYHAVGCVACHSPEQTLPNSVPLGRLEQKYTLDRLVRFLEDPLASRPSGRMPDMRLGHFEAIDIASYLLRDAAELPSPLKLQPALAAAGKAYFDQYGCAACHPLENAAPRPASALALAELRADQGCLSEETGPWPSYELSEAQTTALSAVLEMEEPELSVEQRIQLTLARFNCIGCHQRGNFGGIPASRDEYFTTDNPNLGEQGRIPPPLTLAGAKLKPEWLRKVVTRGESARPYMRTRMPRFGETNVIHLVDWLLEADSLPPADIARVGDEKLARETGRKLTGDKGLSCIACHTFRNESAGMIRALELTTMTERLQENWFHHYLLDPQRFRPLVIMPTYWPEGNSMLKDLLDGDTGKQIDALWQYLSEGRNVGAPSGLVLEPLPLIVQDEAVILRRSYPGIGKRGIGVGYPSGVSLSFDAGQMRLGSIWRGEFIEASPVWRGQGSGTVRIQGTNVVQFPVGPAFALLASEQAPWPEDDGKKAEGFQFKGYTLDHERRPEFRYEFGPVAIRDRFHDLKDAEGRAFFRRVLSFNPNPALPNLYLRLAVHESIVEESPGVYRVGPLLELRLPRRGLIRPHPEGRELALPVGDQPEAIIEYHW